MNNPAIPSECCSSKETSQNARVTEATLHDVASVVGVSAATVSRILAGKHGFSKDTQERVRRAASELSYTNRKTRNKA